VNSCEHTDITISRTRDPVSDEEWSYGGRKQVYIFYWTIWKHLAEILTMHLYHSIWKPLINFKDNLQKGSGTDVELIFPG